MANLSENMIFINTPGILSPIALRTQTSDSDVELYKQVYIQGEHNYLPRNYKPKFIIDGGANIGLTVLFFSHIYPGAKIYAVEAETSNFELLKYNTYFYQDIELFQKGIWDKDTNLIVKDIGLGKCGFIVEETRETGKDVIEAVTINTLLKQSGHQEIDILKLDIEGAEKEVFSGDCDDWLGNVGLLIIELHDRMKAGCSDAFYNAISKYDFERMVQGENVILVNKKKFPGI